jgi:hypothetical protein
MTTLNKNYTQIDGATDEVSDIDARHNSAVTEIEADMTTIESHLNDTTNPHEVDATDVSLGNCDNTSDADKPISDLTQSALDLKQDIGANLGDAVADSINHVAITDPGTSATITIADGKTLTASDDADVSGTNTGDQTDETLTFSDVDTNDSSDSKHGFLKKLSGTAGQFMNGAGDWAVPTSGTGNTLSPATTTDGKIPQWNGNNSNTLKDGLTPPTGALVGTTDTQELTNKTITIPIIKSWDGWNSVVDSWSYASAVTITVPSGAATLYSKGDKLKLTQTTVKYFYIVNVADTTLTITGGSDYTLANAAISSIYISHGGTPIGFPQYFNYTPAWTNLTIGNASQVADFTMIGKTVYFRIDIVLGNSSSVGTNASFTFPVTSKSYSTGTAATQPIGQFRVWDASPAAVYDGLIMWKSTADAYPEVIKTDSTYAASILLSATVPITWTTSDEIHLVGMYESS